MDELSTIITMIDNVTNATSAPPDKGDDFDAHVAKMSNIITRPIILIFGTVGRSVFTHLYVKLLGTLKMIILLGSVHYIRQAGACGTYKGGLVSCAKSSINSYALILRMSCKYIHPASLT